MTVSNALIEVQGLAKSFQGNVVFEGLDFELPKGSVTAIIGPSGSGKSTILRSLNALDRPDSGRVRIADVAVDFGGGVSANGVAHLRAKTAMVFQNYNLFANLTAIDNVSLALTRVRKLDKPTARAQAEQALVAVGLASKIGAYPHQLSGGQQQRVGIARALALNPEVLLLDEPTSALDPELVGEVLDVIRSLAQAGRTMVLVTHEINFARQVADEVLFLDAGKIIERGQAREVLTSPQEPRTREFLARYLSFEI